jgi:hypothetical protein
MVFMDLHNGHMGLHNSHVAQVQHLHGASLNEKAE